MMNLYTLSEVSSTTHYAKTGKAMQKKMWFGVVQDHSRSLEIATFDRAHTSSY